MAVHVPAPAGERWKTTVEIAESVSLALPLSVTVPARGEPGSVRLPLGATSSTLKEAWVPLFRDDVTVDVLLPVPPAVI